MAAARYSHSASSSSKRSIRSPSPSFPTKATRRPHASTPSTSSAWLTKHGHERAAEDRCRGRITRHGLPHSSTHRSERRQLARQLQIRIQCAEKLLHPQHLGLRRASVAARPIALDIEPQPSDAKYRRSTSSASAPPMQLVDEEDEEGYDGSTDRRRSEAGFGQHIPQAPPSMTEEEEAEFEAAQKAARDTLSGWHYAPLGVALAPPLGALLGGHSDAWSDAILLILASFWLYQFLRIPWEIYYASRTRNVLSHDHDEDEIDQDAPPKSTPETTEQKEARAAAAAELRRSELLSLIFCVLSPLLGAYMLHWMRETMTDGNKYLNTFNIRLFTLAAGIKPWSHATSLIRRRMLHLQEEVHHPSSKVEKMNQRLRRLEADLSSLRKLYATKNELRVLREHDAQLGRAVRRSERKEEHLRLSAEEKFSIVEGRLEDLLREVAINAELIEDERREREQAASIRISLFEAVKYLLGWVTCVERHRSTISTTCRVACLRRHRSD